MVEYASTLLMSSWNRAMVSAKRAVTPPMTATTFSAVGETSNNGLARATRYTPAVTMVAAWISALTGVGPSIASGSDIYRCNCADFAVHARNSSRQMMVMVKVVTPLLDIWLKTPMPLLFE